MTDQLAVVIENNNLSPDTGAVMQKAFSQYFNQARELTKDAKSIVVTREDQADLMALAREKRLELKNIRIEVEKTRKTMKEESLRTGKAIDGMANIIKFLIVPVEDHLQLQEDFIKIQEEKRKTEIAEARKKELSEYQVITDDYDLANMGEETYKQLLDNGRLAYEAQLEAERKAEEERVEAEKRRLAEEKRIKEENEKLKKEAEEREKLAKIEREKQAKKEAEEKKRLDELKAKQEAELRKEREAREKAEAELKAKQEAEEKARRDAEEKARQEELARLKAEKEARLAPDKDKMRTAYKEIQAFTQTLRTDFVFQNEEVQEVMSVVIQELNKQLKIIEEKMKSL